MVQGKWFPSGSDIALPLSIRKQVFGLGRDARDDWAQQVVVYNNGEAVGTARLYWQDGAFVMDGLCVRNENRGQGLGDLLIRLCLFKALTHGQNRVSLTAPAALVPYFARYGFQPENNEKGENIPMCVLAKDIHLDGCNGHCDGCRQPR